jgi:hypothetical protein
MSVMSGLRLRWGGALQKPGRLRMVCVIFRGQRGLGMTRFSAAAAVSIFLGFFTPTLATAQSALAPASESRRTAENIVCDGGSVRDGRCTCPAGFDLRPSSENVIGGTCVKTHAENCLGGELTVDGRCLCNSQVVMSGETYLLEYVRGKCVPKRCPVQTIFKGGQCVATSAVSPGTGPEPAASGKPARPKGEASEEEERRQRCGRGMVRTRSGCVAVRRRHPHPYYHLPFWW